MRSIFKSFIKVFSFIMLLGFCQNIVFADENTIVTNKSSKTSNNKVDNNPKDSKHKLDKLTITGTGSVRKLDNTPIKTGLISKQSIINKGAFNLYDALDGSPGLVVEQQCSACNFTQVRMLGTSPGNTKILINGLPLFTGLAGVYGLQQYLSGNIEKIEIVKGAGSSLYGGDAVAGVVNVILADPGKDPVMSLTTSFETHGSSLLNFVASKRFKNWAIVATVQKSKQGEIDENGDEWTDRVATDNFAGNFNIFWYKAFGFFDRINFFGGAINEDRKGGELKDIDGWENPFGSGSEHVYTKRLEFGMSMLKWLNRKSKIVIKGAASSHKRDATNGVVQEEVFTTATSISNSSQLPMPLLADEKLYFVDGTYTLKIDSDVLKQNIMFGVQYRRSDFSQEIGQYVSGTRSTTKKNADDFGIFLQDELSLGDNLDFVVGGRFDLHKSEENYVGTNLPSNDYDISRFSPRFAVRVSPVKSLNLRASIGTGFRVPYHFAEDLHLCAGSPKIYKPSDLKAEKSVTATAGAEYKLNKSLKVGVNYTFINVKDKLSFDTGNTNIPIGYDDAWQNAGNANSHGVDFAIDFIPSKIIDFKLNFSYVNAKYDENPFAGSGIPNESKGKNVMRSPKWSGNFTVNVKPGDFAFYFNLKYTGSMYILTESPSDEIIKTDGFFVGNLRASWKATKILTVFAGVKNLFNYVQEDRRVDDAAFIYAPITGIEIYGGATVKL